MGINDVKSKIELCIDYLTLYALEDDFNSIGLTIQTTPDRKVALCKLVGGKAKTAKAAEDYIYIGSLETSSNEISPTAMQKILSFVKQSHGKADKISDKARGWKDGIRMYGKAIRIGENREQDKSISEGKDSGYPITEG